MKNHSCFQPIIVLVLALLSFACTSPQQRAVLDSADSLMNARPDSALTLLNALLPDTTRMSKGDLMRFHLLRTNAQNKCDTVLSARHASLMRRVCDYYDRYSSSRWWGKASPLRGDEKGASRMLAHYLLGRCYSDMGEAPAALQEFHNAADAADTTNVNCDYHTLSRILAQMASLYYNQNMFDKQQQTLDRLSKCTTQTYELTMKAWTMESMATLLDITGKKQEALSVLRNEYKLLQDSGRTEQAARVVGILIGISDDLESYEGFEGMLDEYEHKSGYFDNSGNICHGKELYYIRKGRWMVHCGKYKQAAGLFQKSLTSNTSFENKRLGAKCMMELYYRKPVVDSIMKYSKLLYAINDSILRNMQTEALLRQESLYDYTRHVQIAKVSESKALREKQLKNNTIALSGFLVFFVICTAVFFWQRVRFTNIKRDMEMRRLYEAYKNKLNDYQQAVERKQFFEGLLNETNERMAMLNQAHQKATIEKEALERENVKKREELEDIQAEKNSLRDSLEIMIEKSREQQEAAAVSIASMKKQLDEYRKNASVIVRRNSDRQLEDTDIVKKIKGYLECSPYKEMTNSDLHELRDEVRNIFPDFYHTLIVEHGMSMDKLDVCILFRLNLKPSDIAKLLGVSRSAITQARQKIYTEITGRQEGKNDFIRLVMQL